MPNINALHAEFILTGSAETAAKLRVEMLIYVTSILRVHYSETFREIVGPGKKKNSEEEPLTEEEEADQKREEEFQGKKDKLSGIPPLAYQIINDITMDRTAKGTPLFRGVSGQFTRFVKTFTRWTANNLIRDSYLPDWKEERAKTPHAPASAFKKEERLILRSDVKEDDNGNACSYNHEDRAITESTAEQEAMKNEFLATLSPLDRQIWELREEWGYEYDEIVEKLSDGLNADQIRYRFGRALAAAEKWGAR